MCQAACTHACALTYLACYRLQLEWTQQHGLHTRTLHSAHGQRPWDCRYRGWQCRCWQNVYHQSTPLGLHIAHAVCTVWAGPMHCRGAWVNAQLRASIHAQGYLW